MNINKHHLKYYLVAITISLAISFLSAYNSIPNNDGFTYLKIAEAYLIDGFAGAYKVYHLPFYSILIAELSLITNISLLNSIYIINAIFQALIVVYFLKIFNYFKPTNRQFIFATISILIFPQFNDYREYILRDYGFWAFGLIGFYYFLQYYFSIIEFNTTKQIIITHRKTYYSLAHFYLFFILASLFRNEALIIAAFLPLSLFLITLENNVYKSKSKFLFTKLNTIFKNNYKLVLPYYILPIYIIITVFIAILILKGYSTTASFIYKIYYSVTDNLHISLISDFSATYNNKINGLNELIFNNTTINHTSGVLFLLLGLSAVFVLKVIKVFNIGNSIILLNSYINRKDVLKYLLFSKQVSNTVENSPILSKQSYKSSYLNLANLSKLILFAAALTLLLPIGYLYTSFITAGRYYLFSSLLLLLFVPFGLDYLLNQLSQRFDNFYLQKLSKTLVYTVLFIMFINGLHSFNLGGSKAYIKQASDYYNTYVINHAYSNGSSVTNNYPISYLSKINNFVMDNNDLVNNLAQYKYILLKIKHSDTNLREQINTLETHNKIKIVKIFNNKRHDSVYIIETA